MKKLRKLKEKEKRLKEQIKLIDEVVSKLKQKLFAMDEISWDLKRNLSMLQREIILGFKELSKDEVLAVRSGLSLEEIQQGKKLVKESSLDKAFQTKTKDA